MSLLCHFFSACRDSNSALHLFQEWYAGCGVCVVHGVHTFFYLVLACLMHTHTLTRVVSVIITLPPLKTIPQPFDDVMYSEVRKGPRYVPKSHSQSPPPQSASPPPPPPPSTISPPPSKPPRTVPGGLSELDNLLEMLNDTQRTIQSNQGD